MAAASSGDCLILCAARRKPSPDMSIGWCQCSVGAVGADEPGVKVGAALSIRPDARSAAVEATLQAARRLGEREPNLAIVFASAHFAPQAEAIVDAVHEAATPQALAGCVAEGVVGTGKEVEAQPAVSVWLASLETKVRTFHCKFSQTNGHAAFSGWPGDPAGGYLLIADPFSFPADLLLKSMNERAPASPFIAGGVASGGRSPGETRLFMDREVLDSGAVGVALTGNVEVVVLVSQGCRPIGQVLTVTRSEGNVIFELGGKAPVQRIQELYASLPEHDRELMTEGLLVGRVIDEYKTELERGDFLVRGVVGADPDSGAIAVGDAVAVGETIKFHVRDEASADEDLRTTLKVARDKFGDSGVAGGLLFTCNGRGSRMFSTPDHDAALLASELGDAPIAGFFCAGELGPVGSKNFLHGFTASMALFSEDAKAP
jgi:small ligand-binding sensory domain FIST